MAAPEPTTKRVPLEVFVFPGSSCRFDLDEIKKLLG